METRKVVINTCYGGFGLSPKAIQRWAELKGMECHFFIQDISRGLHSEYISATIEEAEKAWMYYTFSISNPNDVINPNIEWSAMSDAECKAYNEAYGKYSIYDRNIPRDDPILVQVVEELGSKVASNKLAELQIVEIPMDVDWWIEEYDGNETIEEAHRSWR